MPPRDDMPHRSGAPTSRVRVKRHPERGAYARATIDAIIDEALTCHLGFALEGQPYVVPTLHGRDGDTVYVHGSAASRMLRALGAGAPACATFTIIDGLVLARSAFHHSANYRSVVLLGELREVSDPGECMHALRAVSEHVLPGRWDTVREPTAKELKATAVCALTIDEASAKVRSGPPIDDASDLALATWAGVLPLALTAGEPVPAPDLAAPVAAAGPPAHVTDWAAVRARQASS